MQKKISLLLFFLSIFLMSLHAIDTQEKRVSIENVKGNTLSFKADNLRVGQSGIILTNIHENSVIIASAEIIKIDGDEATAHYRTFETIKQRYLPTPESTPKVGDIIIFNGLYNRAIAIAPNQESYNAILEHEKNVSFSHIDLFGAFLAKDGINDPKPKHFRQFCNAYSIGLIYILASNGVNVLDCESFEVIQTIAFEKPVLKNTDTPFFSRIVAIDTGSLASKLRSKKSKNYFPYYDDLLHKPLSRFQNESHK